MVRRSKFGSVSCQVEKRKSSKGTRPNKSHPVGFDTPARDSVFDAAAAKAFCGKHELIAVAINMRVAEIKLRDDSTVVNFLKKYLDFEAG